MKKILSLKNAVISIAILIGIWQIAYTFSGYSDALFPSPYQSLLALIEMIKDGSLLENIKTSMYRFLSGYVTSVVSAVLLGLILGRFPSVFKYVNP
ncbi:MAG: ABC transporter permease, partial [Ruminococcus sp.]